MSQTMPSAQSTGARTIQRQMSDRKIVLWFILPTIILLIVMNIFPLIYSLFLSFTNYSVIADKPPQWIGIQNYTAILSDKNFWAAFATTGRYALLTVILQTVIGFGLALLLRNKFKGSGLVTTLILIPMMLSPIVVATFWKLIFKIAHNKSLHQYTSGQ